MKFQPKNPKTIEELLRPHLLSDAIGPALVVLATIFVIASLFYAVIVGLRMPSPGAQSDPAAIQRLEG
jgi:hypothetical protein